MNTRTTLMIATLSLSLAAAGCNNAGNNAAANANKAAPANAVAANNSAAKAATPPAAAQIRLALAPNGLEAEMAGEKKPLNFGSPMAQAVSGLTALYGPPLEDASNTECGGGEAVRIVRWSNGLRILSMSDQFQGWETDQAGLVALNDLQVGMTRAQLDANQASTEQTTLGTEWTVGDGNVTVSGLLSDNTPNGRATHMWAGITCHMT